MWSAVFSGARRSLKDEKVFSIFETHTRWISKGKAGTPVELGVPVCVLEDNHGFILHHEVMWQGSDVDYAQPMIRETQARFPDFRWCSFDRGFHNPENKLVLDELLDHNVLPRKGSLSKADRDREQDAVFVAMRRQHPAIESAINNLEHRGLDRTCAFGADGFAPRGGTFHRGFQQPPHRPAVAQKGAATTRRLTAISRQSVIPGPPKGGNGTMCPDIGDNRQI